MMIYGAILLISGRVMPDEGNGLLQFVRAEPLRPALRDTVSRPARGHYAGFTHFLLITSGGVMLDVGEDQHLIGGPVGLILPPEHAVQLTLSAGTAGWLVGASAAAVTEAVGTKAESQLLHKLGAQLFVAQDLEQRFATDFLHPAAQIQREIDHATRGSQMAIIAHLRLLLLGFWRSGDLSPEAAQRGRSDQYILLEFRRLVELNFRSQIQVAAYAGLLGISYDRLHRICQSSMNRSPLQLIHQRMMREAALRLERSGETIQAIAHALGFDEASQFSHFFRRNGQMPPSVYRTAMRQNATANQFKNASLADWP
jgi:AraC family transcriptional regulator, transcriptional activator of pobA